jgi:hypothetical protein
MESILTPKISIDVSGKGSFEREFITYSNQDASRPNRNTAALQSLTSEERPF